MDIEQYGQSTKGFMALPLELRQMVYENLLTPDCTISDKKGAQFGLNPAILRVSKQICAEATEMLYEKGGVILLEIERVVVQQIGSVSAYECCHRFPGDYPIRELSDQNLWSEPLMKMRLTRVQPVAWAEGIEINGIWVEDHGLKQQFIGFKEMLPRFFRFMAILPTVAHTRITLEINDAIDSPGYDLQALLHDARGFGVADIQDSKSTPIHTQLASKMASSIRDVSIVLEGITHYEFQIRNHSDAGRFHAANTATQEAKQFFAWAIHYLSYQVTNISDTDRNKLELVLRRKGIALVWQDVSLDIKSKRLQEARFKVHEIFTHLARSYPELSKREADCHYYLGRISLEEGNRIGALWAFFKALCEYPSHEKINEEIDSLELSVQGCDDLEDCVIRHNIRYVFTNLRHQNPESPKMDPDRVRELREAFVATDKQKQQATVSTVPIVGRARNHSSYCFRCEEMFNFRLLL